ncbi:hypothetical protein Tco_1450754 [Tanacetum coccineum]
MLYKKKHRKERSYPSEIYSNQKIIEVIRVNNEKGYGQDFMEEIIMVHDYQLGIESYQIKINLTTLTLVIPSTEKLEFYTIITNPFIRIVNKNSKNEKRVMNIEEFPKFCNATLKKVLRKVQEISTEVRYRYKDPNLNAEDREIMKFFEEEIQGRLKYRDHMRR